MLGRLVQLPAPVTLILSQLAAPPPAFPKATLRQLTAPRLVLAPVPAELPLTEENRLSFPISQRTRYGTHTAIWRWSMGSGLAGRSEERRVGKEGRYRWSPY